MSEKIIETVLMIAGKEESEILRLRILSLLNEILSYLNRNEITEEMFPVVATVIAECISKDELLTGGIQSFSEGDMSVTYLTNSPFYGKLDSFKVIRGIG